MAGGTAIAAIAGAVIAAAGTTHAVIASNQARQDAQDAAAKQEADQKKLQDDATAKQAQQQAQADAAAQQKSDLERQKLLQAQNQGTPGTILTSPLGVPNAPAPTAGKTLLGG